MAKTIKNRLLIHFHDNQGEQISWTIQNNGGKDFPVYHGKLPDINTNLSYQQIIVLVPASELFITTVTLPNIPTTQQAQAALYLLEEQLAEDVQALHAIVIPQEKQNQFTAIIVKKRLLKQWITLLREHNINPTLLLPDVFALPVVNEGWSVLLWKTLALIKTGPKTGFSIEASNLANVVSELPPRIEIRNDSTQPLPAPFNAITTSQIIIHDNQGESENILFSQNFSNEGNLLSGEFMTAVDKAYSRQRWKLPTILLATMLLVYSGSSIAQWLYLKHENNNLQQQITTLYKQVFPNASSVISPKLRIEQEMQNKQTNISNNDFLYLLAQVGKALTQQNHVELDSIAFQDDELILRIHSKTVSDLANLQSQLKKQTIQIEQKETSSTKAGVNAEFHIKRAT